ncbi:MAG TPA: SH3 domain-containing protein [Vineibacter sp.]|nr:SH3 domain-containing protein [Vineibacter sp.]
MLRFVVAARQAVIRTTGVAVVVALGSLAVAILSPAPAQQISSRAGEAPPPLRKGTGLPLPRFATLRSDETNVRAGPGSRYPIDWVFKRKAMPVEIVAEYENWRKIRDWQGAGGWVHQSLLTGKRSVTITAKEATLHKTPAGTAAPVAKLQTEVICGVRSCSGDWCRVQVGPHVGWIERNKAWGVYPGEVVN